MLPCTAAEVRGKAVGKGGGSAVVRAVEGRWECSRERRWEGQWKGAGRVAVRRFSPRSRCPPGRAETPPVNTTVNNLWSHSDKSDRVKEEQLHLLWHMLWHRLHLHLCTLGGRPAMAEVLSSDTNSSKAAACAAHLQHRKQRHRSFADTAGGSRKKGSVALPAPQAKAPVFGTRKGSAALPHHASDPTAAGCEDGGDAGGPDGGPCTAPWSSTWPRCQGAKVHARTRAAQRDGIRNGWSTRGD